MAAGGWNIILPVEDEEYWLVVGGLFALIAVGIWVVK